LWTPEQNMTTCEALKIQLDTMQLECQALQVENARLRGENPQTAAKIETEREELSGLKQEVEELCQTLHESRETELQLTDLKVVEELSETRSEIEQANEEFGGKEAAARQKITELQESVRQEITELQEINGRLLSNKLNCMNFGWRLNIIKLID